jgi:hypothetical protein
MRRARRELSIRLFIFAAPSHSWGAAIRGTPPPANIAQTSLEKDG